MGRRLRKPAELRCTVAVIRSITASWPMILSSRKPCIWSKRSDSLMSSRSSGMPDSLATTAATSSGATSAAPARELRAPARSTRLSALSGSRRSAM